MKKRIEMINIIKRGDIVPSPQGLLDIKVGELVNQSTIVKFSNINKFRLDERRVLYSLDI